MASRRRIDAVSTRCKNALTARRETVGWVERGPNPIVGFRRGKAGDGFRLALNPSCSPNDASLGVQTCPTPPCLAPPRLAPPRLAPPRLAPPRLAPPCPTP